MDAVNERLAQILDRTGHFRILRRVPETIASPLTAAERTERGLATAIVLDTETTGLGPDDEVIELAMAAIAFDPVFARIDRVTDVFSAFRQPSRPIPHDVVRLTGITDADVAGHAIDAEAVAAFVAGASVVWPTTRSSIDASRNAPGPSSARCPGPARSRRRTGIERGSRVGAWANSSRSGGCSTTGTGLWTTCSPSSTSFASR